jgi:acetyltransferase-like isoleucine patch superfamily enzyme
VTEAGPVTLPHDWFPEPLPANVVLGERSWLYSSYAFLHYRSRRPCGLRVGHDSGIYTGTIFDLGPAGEVQIGDYSTLVGPIISSNGRVVVGDYSLISHQVVIADSFAAAPPGSRRGRPAAPAAPAAPDAPAAPAEPATTIAVGENVWIGARATLLPGAHIGEGAIVGAGAVVDFDVPAYAVVAGNPARVVGWAWPEPIT